MSIGVISGWVLVVIGLGRFLLGLPFLVTVAQPASAAGLELPAARVGACTSAGVLGGCFGGDFSLGVGWLPFRTVLGHVAPQLAVPAVRFSPLHDQRHGLLSKLEHGWNVVETVLAQDQTTL